MQTQFDAKLVSNRSQSCINCNINSRKTIYIKGTKQYDVNIVRSSRQFVVRYRFHIL